MNTHYSPGSRNQAAAIRAKESIEPRSSEDQNGEISDSDLFESSGLNLKDKYLYDKFHGPIPTHKSIRPEPLGVQIMKADKYFKLRDNPLPLCPNKFKIQATLREGQFESISEHTSQEFVSSDISNHLYSTDQEEDVKGFILHTTSCSFLLEPLITPPMFLTKEAQRRSIIIITIKSAISSITMLTVVFILIYYHYDLIYQAIQSKGILANSIMFRVKCYLLIFIECLLMTIHVPPFLECCILPEWQVLVLIRLVQVTKVLRQNCKIHQRIIGKMLGGLASLQKVSTVRVYLLTHPYSCITACYVFCTVCLGYLTFVVERVEHEIVHHQEKSFGSVLWMMVVTITSLGFGDVVPHSYCGKILVSVVSILGVLLAAVFISTTQKYLQVPDKEKRLFEAIRQTELSKERLNCAARAIQLAWKYYRLKKKLDECKESINIMKLENSSSHQNIPAHIRHQSNNDQLLSSNHNISQSASNLNRKRTISDTVMNNLHPERNRKSHAHSNRIRKPSSALRDYKTKNELSVLVILQNHRFQRALWEWVKAKSAYKTNMANAHDTRNMMLNMEVKVDGIEKNLEDMKDAQEKINKLLEDMNNKLK